MRNMRSNEPMLILMLQGLLVGGCGQSEITPREGTSLSGQDEKDAALPGKASRALRLLSPMSGSLAGSNRPILRWEGPDEVLIQLCHDRSCHSPFAEVLGSGHVAQPQSELTAGVVFWRARNPNHRAEVTPAWELFIPALAGAGTASANRGFRYDADEDGFDDAAIREEEENTGVNLVHVYMGTESGLDAKHDTVLGPTGRGFPMSAAGDTDGDGFGDLLVSSTDSVLVYGGSKAGPKKKPLTQIPSLPSQIVYHLSGAGDVNGDGYGDVVVDDGQTKVWVFLGSPNGPSSTPAWVLDRTGTFERFVRLLTCGDLNGDGFSDVVVSDYGPMGTPQGFRLFRGGASGLESPSAGTFVETAIFPSGVAADINGDGTSDLLVQQLANLSLYRGGPDFPSATPTQTVTFAARPDVVETGDYDGDGDFDMVLTTSTQTEIVFITNDRLDVYLSGPNGFGTVASQTILETSVLPDNVLGFGYLLGSGDFNGDHRDDLLVGAPAPFPSPVFDTTPGVAFVYPGTTGGLDVQAVSRIEGKPGFARNLSTGVP